MHPILLPGTHVLRRGPRHVQVGLTTGAVLPEAAAVPGRTDRVPDPAVTARLVAAGVALADDHPLRSAMPPSRGDLDPRRHTFAAVARRTPDLADVAARRDRHLLEVESFGHPISARLRDELLDLCSRTGLRTSPPPRRAAGGRPTPVGVLLGVGEPRRELLDPWVRSGRPHLVVRWIEGEALVGPFVVPGRTACLRCHDAYRTAEDPAWPLLVEQYARATRTDRSDGVPEPLDASLGALAVAWAVAEVAAYVDGAEPASLGATLRLTVPVRQVEAEHWPRHPRCGCDWT